jgi:hypothetical protein
MSVLPCKLWSTSTPNVCMYVCLRNNPQTTKHIYQETERFRILLNRAGYQLTNHGSPNYEIWDDDTPIPHFTVSHFNMQYVHEVKYGFSYLTTEAQPVTSSIPQTMSYVIFLYCKHTKWVCKNRQKMALNRLLKATVQHVMLKLQCYEK